MSSLFKKCKTSQCRGKASPKLWKSPFCSKCRSRRWRSKHPIESAFSRLKHHAKERRHKFTLTIEYFRAFCNSNDYIKKRGVTAGSLTIDRIKNELGYEPGNIHLLTNSENVRKQFVPYFKNKREMEAAIRETEAKIREAYPEVA